MLLISSIVLLTGGILWPPIYTASLNHAIKSNDTKAVKMLLWLPGDINRYNSMRIAEYFGNRPLQEACIQGNIEIVKELLEAGAEVNMEEWTPLTLALANEHPNQYQVVQLLLDNEASLESKQVSPILTLLSGGYNSQYKSVYTLGTKKTSDDEKVFEIFMLLVDSGASLKEWENAKRYQLSYVGLILTDVAVQGNVLVMEYLVEKEHFNINEKLYEENTSLMIASGNDNKDMVEYLLLQGADPALKNEEGKTAIDIAKEKGYEDIVDLLK